MKKVSTTFVHNLTSVQVKLEKQEENGPLDKVETSEIKEDVRTKPIAQETTESNSDNTSLSGPIQKEKEEKPTLETQVKDKILQVPSESKTQLEKENLPTQPPEESSAKLETDQSEESDSDSSSSDESSSDTSSSDLSSSSSSSDSSDLSSSSSDEDSETKERLTIKIPSSGMSFPEANSALCSLEAQGEKESNFKVREFLEEASITRH